MNILKITPILPGKVFQMLEEYKKERELTFIENRVYTYLQTVQKLKPEDQEKLYEELKEINIPDEIRIKIVEILPKDEEELKTVLYTYTISKEDAKKILEIIKKYL